MDTNLLRSWLGLPPGPWPPDDRTLLGLQPSAGPADAEKRAMVLMGKLRPHQLMQPDLVTEGMNRLAQALLAITASGTVIEPEPEFSLAPEVDLGGVVMESPQVVDAEVVDATVVKQPVTREKTQPEPVKTAPVKATTIEQPTINLEIDQPIPEPVVVIGSKTADRRDAYRELAGLRTLLQAWDQLKPIVARASDPLPTAGHVFEFIEARAAITAAFDHPGLKRDDIREISPRVVAVMQQPLALAIYRSLTAKQRLDLARDWAVARASYLARAQAIRRILADTKVKKGSSTKALSRMLGNNPEWILVAATIALFLIAGLKWYSRSS